MACSGMVMAYLSVPCCAIWWLGMPCNAAPWLGVRCVAYCGLALYEIAYSGLVCHGVCMPLGVVSRAVEWHAALASSAASLLLPAPNHSANYQTA